LRAAIEWSYDLLTPEEQQLFCRLSVFAGGCALEAAERVCDADVDTVQSLVEKSLLRFSYGRYWMLETIREYAGSRLQDSGGAAEAERRFFNSLLALAEEVEFGSREREWLERVEAEHENVRAALGVAPSPDLGLRLAAALGEFWLWKGHIREGRQYLDDLLEAATGAPDEIRARGSLVAADLAAFHDDYAAASALLDAAETLFARLGDSAGLARVLLLRSWTAFLAGDFEVAVGFLEEALARIETGRLRHLLPRALRMLSVVEDRRDNHEKAGALQERALAASHGPAAAPMPPNPLITPNARARDVRLLNAIVVRM
jgi:hypothetical protein